MNTIAVKAFLRGALQEAPTDEQIEELIELLQKHVKHSKIEREVLRVLQEAELEGTEIEDSEALMEYFFDIERDEVEIAMDLYTSVDWEYLFEELHRAP